MTFKILVSDNLDDSGISLFKEEKDIQVDVNTGLHPEELKEIIGQYDALVIRSATKVTKDLLSKATNLKVVGRAGIGLDNVDVDAATQRGVAVMNTPGGNTITTAEHAISMIMSLARRIPQATASMKNNLWEKKKFMGSEVFHKVCGVVGFGNIGSIVADRARALKMNVIVYDPNIASEYIEEKGFKSVSFDELVEQADYITVHVPRIKNTISMLNKDVFNKMKDGVIVINCARGGIVNEKDLYDAIKAGKVGGAALDVFEVEPPVDSPLLSLDNVIATPHLGASTYEAQKNVAVAVAEQIIKYLKEGTILNAVNVPSVTGDALKKIEDFLFLAGKIGLLHSQLAEGKGAIRDIKIEYTGNFQTEDMKNITISALKGLLTPLVKDSVNFVNAPVIAKQMGINVSEKITPARLDYNYLVLIRIKTDEGEHVAAGTLLGKTTPRIVRVDDFRLEMVPHGHLILIKNQDKPGAIGSIGEVLGKNNINIARMTVGRNKENESNIIFVKTDTPASEKVIAELKNLPMVISARAIELGEGPVENRGKK